MGTGTGDRLYKKESCVISKFSYWLQVLFIGLVLLTPAMPGSRDGTIASKDHIWYSGSCLQFQPFFLPARLTQLFLFSISILISFIGSQLQHNCAEYVLQNSMVHTSYFMSANLFFPIRSCSWYQLGNHQVMRCANCSAFN